MKVGVNRDEDERRVEIVRQQIGADCDLVWFISRFFSYSRLISPASQIVHLCNGIFWTLNF